MAEILDGWLGVVTENVPLEPTWPFPSSALRYMFVAPCSTDRVPDHTPLLKLPETADDTWIGCGPAKGRVRLALGEPMLGVAVTQSELPLLSLLPTRW